MYCVFLGRATATNAPGAGSVGASQLASDAVTTAKILDSNITTAKILDSNITTAKIATQLQVQN
jgi:TRAP-type mannitol/chloroaromatic compound transport system permease large subunit